MLAALNKLAESLLWQSRRQVVDRQIERLSAAFEQRFRRQKSFVLRRCLPILDDAKFFEAARSEITKSLLGLNEFVDKAMPEVYDATVVIALNGGAQHVATTVSYGGQRLAKDYVVQYLKDHAAEQLGRDVDETTAGMLRRLLVKSQEESWTRARTVKEIKGLYDGFTTRTRGVVRNRAELIAVNEIGNAYSDGSLQMARDIEADGQAMQKAWAVSANACAICDPNAGAGWIALDKPFPSGHDRPLAHVRCRCSILIRAKPLSIDGFVAPGMWLSRSGSAA